MPDANWPATLPAPLKSGYKVSDELPVIKTEMESGPARVSRISSSYTSTISVKFVLDAAEIATLKTFFEGGANFGADWFNIPIDTGAGLVDHRSRFVSAPQRVPIVPGYWTVSFNLETEERN